jgi:hypothetical protein
MCILYRGEGSLPRNRAEVYEQCANLLFRRWDARRRIHQELRAGHLVEPALRHLAWWLFTRSDSQTAVTERELVATTTEFLRHKRSGGAWRWKIGHSCTVRDYDRRLYSPRTLAMEGQEDAGLAGTGGSRVDQLGGCPRRGRDPGGWPSGGGADQEEGRIVL